MLIAHLSDFHVCVDAPETSLVRPDAVDRARKVVADVAGFSPKLDAVMVTGDLTDGGTVQDYELFASVIAPIDAPVFVVPGNHDRREGLRAAFADRLPFGDRRFLNYEATCGAIRVIGLDTQIEGRIDGGLEPDTLDWLEERLSQPAEGHTYILMHHPPCPSGLAALDGMALTRGGDRFGELVRSYEGSLHILAGHLHRPYQTIWNGALATVGGSPAFQFALDLHPGATEPGTDDEPYFYFIYRLGHDGETVHTRPVSLQALKE
ncbi:MAG: serine/threonine protein phosphatase [Hyphomicrobiales bacterium]|nr:serine/threonine protein phosphatase [Hyphomicrobiales bacterium]